MKAFLLIVAAAAALAPAAVGGASAGPSAPTNLKATIVHPHVIVSWQASPVAEAVVAYSVYRDGELLGSVRAPAYTDTPRAGLRPTAVYTVQARDRAGNSSPLSAPLTVVLPRPAQQPQVPGTPPALVAPPRIAGRARPGSLLVARRAQWKDSTPTAVAYQWLRCRGSGACSNIVRAQRRYYRVRRADVGWRLRVVETARHSAGTTTASSPPSAIVKPR